MSEHEAAEIAAARLRPGEAAEIRGRLEAAQHGEAIARSSSTLHDALIAEEGGARESIAIALREARALARLDPRFEPLAERIEGLEAEIADVASTARELSEAVDHDPAELARLEERLSTIFGLERRYGDDEAAVIAHGERGRGGSGAAPQPGRGAGHAAGRECRACSSPSPEPPRSCRWPGRRPPAP